MNKQLKKWKIKYSNFKSTKKDLSWTSNQLQNPEEQLRHDEEATKKEKSSFQTLKR
jgi:hypothetical protein